MKTTTPFVVFLLHCLVAAAQPHSQPIVVSPAHQYNCGPTIPASFHHIPSLPNTLVPSWTLRAVPTTVYRPRSQESLKHPAWEPVEVLGPDVQDRHTLSQLARISGNAYALPGQKNWYDVDSAWNLSFPFGWEDSTEGFRGHVFLSPDNGTAILSIKVDFSWIFSTVCDCFSGHWTCDNTCLTQALIEDSLFYSVGMNLVKNLTLQYPDANIWLVGHSLGGALASLLGTTFGLPVVAFESPGERLAARRLHLPLPPPSNTSGLPVTPVTHVYHNADPIPQGACTGFRSACASAGYALETRCHLGKSIVYDTVGKLGWRVSVQSHPIKEVILRVIEGDQQWEEGRDVPLAVEEVDCIDCYKWEFGEFKNGTS
ncbi:alpha/beta-hydrolase [Lactarius indigo]|nr:alpha/beta-hydrolase [Lactarius indigo]